jgi:uncharacterized protein
MKLCRWSSLMAFLVWLAAAAGCARSPKATFYTLDSGAGAQAIVSAPVSYSVAVGAITLPEVVDRQQLVVRGNGNRVDILEMQRWAEPLRSEIPRLLAENLKRLLGTERVSSYPQSAGRDADFRVLVDIQRFEAQPGESVTVEALWTIRPTAGGASKTGHSLVREPVRGTGYDIIVAAYSRALATVSTEIARDIRSDNFLPPRQ